MSRLVPVSEARASLSALIKQAADHDITLMNHGRPAAMLLSAERYDALLEEIEDLKDRLSVHERDGVTVSFDHLVAELDIGDEVHDEPVEADRRRRA
ncbi:MAG: type II toxin-antitoxin system prevent-host-death family antitoxin [Mycobacterium sp.]|nr:type II toxin-antitoxin system prevent-host-death family antitoxin [Mycobacterium sp.]